MISTIAGMSLFLSHWIELSILTKATIMLLLGLAAAWLARRGRASVRHLLLVVTFGALFTLPLIVVMAPGLTIEVPVTGAIDSSVAVRSIPPSEATARDNGSHVSGRAIENDRRSELSWPTIFRLTWITGTILLFLQLAVDLLRLGRFRRNGLPWTELRERFQLLAAECSVRRPVDLLLHEAIAAPLTCGVLRSAIVLPCDARGWGEIELRCALVHELEHVRRRDYPVQLVARALCAFYWLNPLVWIALRRLCLESERACDDAVIQSEEPVEYAGQLVSLARRMSTARAQPAIAMANRSDLSTRVSALLDSSQRRGPAGLLAAAAAMSAASVVLLAVAPVRAVAQAPLRLPSQSDALQFHNSAAAAERVDGSHATRAQTRYSGSFDRALFEAAQRGDLDDIGRSLDSGANPNSVLRGDGSPLIAAAREGRLSAVRLLLDRGADPNMPVHGDGSPLIAAAREGHAEVVTLLLDRGAQIDQMVPNDENALIQASGRGNFDVVRLLLSRRANPNARVWVAQPGEPNGEWRSPLSMAIKGRHDAVVALLQSAGARE